MSGMRILDVGAGYSKFLLTIHESGLDCELHATDPIFSKKSQKHLSGVRIRSDSVNNLGYLDDCFDRIFCLSMLEHISFDEQIHGMQEMSRCLKPGGRLIATVDYFLRWSDWCRWRDLKPERYQWLPGRKNVNIKELIDVSGLHFWKPDRVDSYPGAEKFSETDVDLDEIWWSEHEAKGLRVSSIGIVLVKAYDDKTLLNMKVRISPEALIVKKNGKLLVTHHIGIDRDPSIETKTLPGVVSNTQKLKVKNFIKSLQIENKDALQTVRQLIEDGILIPERK